MTQFFERTALILLAGTALTACAAPQYPIVAPLAQPTPAPVAPVAAAPAMAAAAPESAAPVAPGPAAAIETQALAPLPPAPPPPPSEADMAMAAAETPTAQDAFARTRAKGPAATYTVKKGDTLGGIADKLGVGLSDLAKANGLKAPYRLHPGQVLKNPKAPKPTPATSKPSAKASGGETYTVKPGDTLYGIARAHGVSVEALQAANGMDGRASIMAGQKLKLPGAGEPAETADAADEETAPVERAASPPPPSKAAEAPAAPSGLKGRAAGRVVTTTTPGKAYKVKRGDTLAGIAGRLDSSVTELARLNRLKKPYRIQPGQTIRGPGGSAKAYVVVSGDSLQAIAARFSVTIDQLRAANGLRRNATVAPGRRLRLPSGYRDTGPISAAEPERPHSSFEAPPPVGQTLPPPRSTQGLPPSPQPYRPVPGAPVASPTPSDGQIAQMGRGLFIWPLRGEILSGFGAKGTSQRNDGVDIGANAGDPVRAAAGGEVVYAGDQVPGFGNLVLIKHAGGWVTAYGHLDRVDVRMQEKVEQGQQIGQAGSTGGVAAPQLHFEVRYAPTPQERARPVDPALVLPK
ncbi:MAG: LysM peptidoglycan-binding domain-containing protein [Phenylobacterium sp.]|uniref:LysM peptidoglycan-binding domain-containing protein n=1 Tax=Phenylobacterium sp. TaxID=1871053 RepID=UPI0025E4AD4D|nr:LysM peptidoglycan-binding domain-containing protein [Phenylobacterium sp.]MBI1196631.1 LysM peptidoglycan-binding domain-containing protein [Phenylobacterium sp.]